MKKQFLWIAVSALALMLSCSKDDPAPSLKLTLKDMSPKDNSKVTIIFKVDDEHGYPIPKLGENAFEIVENNKSIPASEAPRKIEQRAEDFTFNVLLLLDISASIKGTSLETLKSASKSFISAVMPNETDPAYSKTMLSIKWFDGDQAVHTLTGYGYEIQTQLDAIESINDNITTSTSTNLNGAIVDVTTELKQRIAMFETAGIISAGAIVVFTDGVDGANWKSDADAVNAINSTGEAIASYAVGLGEGVDKQHMSRLGKEGYELADNISDLSSKFANIAQFVEDESNSYYTLDYCPAARNGANIPLQIIAESNGVKGSITGKFTATGFTDNCTLE